MELRERVVAGAIVDDDEFQTVIIERQERPTLSMMNISSLCAGTMSVIGGVKGELLTRSRRKLARRCRCQVLRKIAVTSRTR
jgi:hypothetical protein